MPFRAVDVDVDELADGVGEDVAIENARRKAQAGAEQASPGEIALGVDTVVTLGGRIWGKPADEADARATLRALSGRTHQVVSGIAVVQDGRERLASETTAVTFHELDGAALDWYLASGEWRGRAGGYAIQGRGGALVARVDGDYLNVVGLPGALLVRFLSRRFPGAYGFG